MNSSLYPVLAREFGLARQVRYRFVLLVLIMILNFQSKRHDLQENHVLRAYGGTVATVSITVSVYGPITI